MTAARRRGRPRSFDADSALESALQAFRRNGYSGTSLGDLTRATGLNRPTLYATFGNKRAFFEAAVDRYWARATRRCLPALRTTGVLARDLRRFLGRFLDLFADEDPGGCIVACALPGDADDEPRFREKLASLLAQADGAVRARLEEAQRRGELPTDADPRRLAGLVVSVMFALSLRSRAGAARDELEALADELVARVTSHPV